MTREKIKSDVIDYHFKILNSVDFNLDIIMIASHGLMKTILDKSIIKFKLEKKSEDILKEKFEIDPKYYNFLKMTISSNIRTLKGFKKFNLMDSIQKEVGEDGIHIYDYKIHNGFFEKRTKGWYINLLVKGTYLRK